jgi:hypothetical protein
MVTTLKSKDWKPLEEYLKDAKEMVVKLNVENNIAVMVIEGDGKPILTITSSNMAIPHEVIRLKLKPNKKKFPLTLSSIDVNLGIVKARFEKNKD